MRDLLAGLSLPFAHRGLHGNGVPENSLEAFAGARRGRARHRAGRSAVCRRGADGAPRRDAAAVVRGAAQAHGADGGRALGAGVARWRGSHPDAGGRAAPDRPTGPAPARPEGADPACRPAPDGGRASRSTCGATTGRSESSVSTRGCFTRWPSGCLGWRSGRPAECRRRRSKADGGCGRRYIRWMRCGRGGCLGRTSCCSTCIGCRRRRSPDCAGNCPSWRGPCGRPQDYALARAHADGLIVEDAAVALALADAALAV